MTTNKRRAPSRKTTRKRTGRTSKRSHFGTSFFVVLAVTMASALGFFGIVASVLAGS